MKYNFGILATALAVGLFTLPAYAAVSDVEGGQINVETHINKHYNEIDGGTTLVRGADKVDKHLEYTVKGVLHYVEGEQYGQNKTVKDGPGFEVTVDNPSLVYSAADQVGYSLFKYAENNSDRRSNLSYGGAKTDHAGNYFFFGVKTNPVGGQWGYQDQGYHNWKSGSNSVAGQYRETSREGTGQRQHIGTEMGEFRENLGKQTTVLTRIESSRSVDPEPGSIMIGDPDAIATAYAAHKNVNVTEVVDKYYDRTHYYDQVYHEKFSEKEKVVYQLNAYRRYSPIILDLDGDGKIEASNGQYLAHDDFSDKVAAFDFFGNGFPVLTEWVGVNDGLLCRPTKDGKVTGAQLFGSSNGMANGYEEMASLDADESGALEGAELQGLYVWTDLNGNAIADKGELKTVQELGITSIKVTHNNYASTFTRNGQTYKTFDWWPNCREMRKVNVAGIFE